MSSSAQSANSHAGDRAAFWQDHVDAWKRSGLSSRQYCERHGLNRGTLGYWSSRLRAAASAEPPRFLPVQVATVPEEPPAGNAGIVLELAEGISVRVAAGQQTSG